MVEGRDTPARRPDDISPVDTRRARAGTRAGVRTIRGRAHAAPALAATVRAARGGPFEDQASASVYAQHVEPAFGRRFAERTLDALAVVRGTRLLDMACGTGIFARSAAHVVGPAGRVAAVDPSPAATETARRIDVSNIVEWHDWCDEGLPFDDASFDVVACQHALHRFDDPAALLAEAARVLVGGGRIGLTTWGPIEENPAFAAQLDAIVASGFEHSGAVEVLLDAFAHHRLEDLEALVRAAGFTDVACRTVRLLTALPPVAQWVRVYPSLPPLSHAWAQAPQRDRVRFLARATELLRPFEHEGVLRVQASSRLVVARKPGP